VELKVGDQVVTSGIEGIYPKGFAIGQIESFERRAGEFTAVMVRPAVEFANREAVLVVMTPPQVDVSGRGKKGEAAAKPHETSPPKANESAVPSAAARKPEATRKPAASPAARSADGNGVQSTNPAAEPGASRQNNAAPPSAPEAR
jgi:rod shape-determining protein MreC